MLFSGDNLHNAVRAGMCFGQIGEFSFIIATVGMSFGVVDDFLYPIIVSVSIITTFLTPYLIKGGEPLFHWIEKKVPDSWKNGFGSKEKAVKSTNGEEMTMKAYLLSQLKNLVLYASIIIALMLVCFSLCMLIDDYVPQPVSGLVSLAVTLLVMSPFLWAVAFKHGMKKTTGKLMAESRFNKNSIKLIFILRIILVRGVAVNIHNHYLGTEFWNSLGLQNAPNHLIALGLSVIYVIVLRVITPVMHWYETIERRFLENMNKRETLKSFVLPEVLQENFTMEKMALSPKSQYVGKRIRETDFRPTYGASVVCVDRADEFIDLPRRDFILYPADEVTFIGTEEQLAKLRPFVEVEDDVLIKERPESDVDIHYSVVGPNSRYAGVSLRDSDLLNRFNVMVIAVERDNEFFLNPQASFVFQQGDIVWFVSTVTNAKALIQYAYETEQLSTEQLITDN